MTVATSRYASLVERAATLLLFAYPASMLALGGGMNGVFLLMLLIAIAVLVVRPAGIAPFAWRREWTAYALSMTAMSLAVFVSQSYHQSYSSHPYDAAARYWLALPVFLLLQRLRPAPFKVLQFAFPVAAILGLLLAQDSSMRLDSRITIRSLDPIHFGDFELVLGALSFFSIGWFGRDRPALVILKLIGLGAGLAASFVSGTRGGWLAIPVFLAVFIYFNAKRMSLKIVAASATALVLGIMLLYWLYPTFEQRVDAFKSDLVMFNQGNRDTSTGVRLQLYGAALDVVSKRPVFGAGPDGFAAEMQPMMESGKITRLAAALGRGEVHNDILSKTVGMGIFGLAAMLAIYIVPFRMFWRAARSAVAPARQAAILGIVFVSGFFVFGLSVEILNLTMAVAFYSFTIAVLLAVCYNSHYSEPFNPNRGDTHV